MKKIKTYVVMCAVNFPVNHSKAGNPTGFRGAILLGDKIHTIRGNYELWKKRIFEVKAGRAELSLREWTGKPYASKQKEFARLGAGDEVGVEKLIGELVFLNKPSLHIKQGDVNHIIPVWRVANHDGLSYQDFTDWFNNPVFPMAIIHFTGFRYVG